MTSVIAETIETLKRKCSGSLQEVRIDDLVIGIFFTGVKLSTGYAGVAFTPAGGFRSWRESGSWILIR